MDLIERLRRAARVEAPEGATDSECDALIREAVSPWKTERPQSDGLWWWMQKGIARWYGGLVEIKTGQSGWLCSDGKRRCCTGPDRPQDVTGFPEIRWAQFGPPMEG